MVDPLPQHKNNFNFLRLLFAMMVVLSHSPLLADGDLHRDIFTAVFGTFSMGEFAVVGFFLLSGYLIVQSWASNPVIFRFLEKRILRIFPGFIVATMFCVFIVAPFAGTAPGFLGSIDLHRFLLDTLLLQKPFVPTAFAGTHYPSLNSPMWTISREFLCYLSALALGVFGGIKRREIWLCITALLLCVLIGQRLSIFREWVDPFYGLAAYFFVGGSFYLYRDKIAYKSDFALVAGLCLFIALFSWRASALALALLGGYLLLYIAFRPIKLLANFGKLPDVSYGVYLYAFPIQKLMYWYAPSISPWLVFVVAGLLSLILGAISWYAIEKPFLSLKRLGRPKTPVSA